MRSGMVFLSVHCARDDTEMAKIHSPRLDL